MLNLVNTSNGVLVDMPTLLEDTRNKVFTAIRKFEHVLPLEQSISGTTFANLISESCNSNENDHLVEALKLVDILPPHYIFATAESIDESSNEYKLVLHKAKGELNEKATVRLNVFDGMKGYPFSFMNADGKLSVALAFGHSEEAAYDQVKGFNEFITPNQQDINVQNRPIDGSMSLATRLAVIHDAVFVLPALNYN